MRKLTPKQKLATLFVGAAPMTTGATCNEEFFDVLLNSIKITDVPFFGDSTIEISVSRGEDEPPMDGDDMMMEMTEDPKLNFGQ